jgi:hypothetical protein
VSVSQAWKTTRRQVLRGLSAYGLVGWCSVAVAAPMRLPVIRTWKGRGRITVLATGHGDPRVPPGADDAEALLLATALADDRERTFVSASGVPESEGGMGDVARSLQSIRPELEVLDGATGEFDDMMAFARVAWGLAPTNNQAFRARRLALALTPFALEHPALADYDKLRNDAFVRADKARDAMAKAALERIAGLPRRAVIVTRALGAAQLCDLLKASGLGGRLVATEEGRTLLEGEELFWTGVEAGLPEPGMEGLMPWARAMGPFHEAFERWPGRAGFTASIAESSEDTPVLEGALRDQVEAAAALLEARGLAPWPEGLPVHVGTGETHAMSYDSFTHRLKVAPVVAELSVPMTAAVLLHELVHVADVAAAAAHLGTDPKGFALLIDRLPLGISTGVLCTMEDHAYHREVAAIPTLGLRLPDPDDETLEGVEGQLGRMLAVLRDAGPGTSRWLALVDRFVGVARQGG